MKQGKSFAHLEKIIINKTVQWVLVRGKNIDAPLLIHVQAGPGMPMISEANEIERRLHLEEKFLVAYWDQRGCGLSFSRDIPLESITLAQMVDDIIACAKYLLKKYNKRQAVIVGYSIGATTSLMAAAKDSSIFSAIFASGIDVDIPFANQYALDFAMKKAVAGNNKKLAGKINSLAGDPIVETKRFQKRAEILTNLGGIKAGSRYNGLVLSTIKRMLFSKYYGIRGLLKTMKGMEFCQNALLPELHGFILIQQVTKVSVPVHFIQGSLDGIAPPEKCKEYYEHLGAVDKTYTIFEKSAHMPQYDESSKFSNLIVSFYRN